MTENLINRLTYYLSSGGLFNPELADHLAVRNLLIECREALAQRTWVGLTIKDVPDKYMGSREFMTGAKWAAKYLKEKNT